MTILKLDRLVLNFDIFREVLGHALYKKSLKIKPIESKTRASTERSGAGRAGPRRGEAERAGPRRGEAGRARARGAKRSGAKRGRMEPSGMRRGGTARDETRSVLYSRNPDLYNAAFLVSENSFHSMDVRKKN